MCYGSDDLVFNRETGEARESRTSRQVLIPTGPIGLEEPHDYEIDKKGNMVPKPFMDDAIWNK